MKWFVPCNTSDNPIPLSAVLTSKFWLFAALFVALYYGTWSAAVVPLASGTALLAIGFLYLQGSRTRWCGWERVVFVMREGVSCRLTTS